jgi:hypothetical protein
LIILASGTLGAAAAPNSEWVHPGRDGKLVYQTTVAGERRFIRGCDQVAW